MSIILDALRRADAERQRASGHSPPWHAPSVLDIGRGPGVWRRVGVAAALMVPLLALTAAAWLWWRERPGHPPSLDARAAPRVVVPAAPPPALASQTSAERLAPQPAAGGPIVAAKPLPPLSPTPAPAAVKATTASVAPWPSSGAPALKVGGSMYSSHAASRVLVLNGQVLREGDTAAPGVVLERIGPKSARLRWQGQVYELSY